MRIEKGIIITEEKERIREGTIAFEMNLEGQMGFQQVEMRGNIEESI